MNAPNIILTYLIAFVQFVKYVIFIDICLASGVDAYGNKELMTIWEGPKRIWFDHIRGA